MGRKLGVMDSTSCSEVITFNYTSALVTQKVFIAIQPCVVTGVMGVPRVAGSGGACTVQFFKVPNGTAVASGTLLHSGSYDLVGAADTNQTMTLVTNPDTLTLKAGDAIGYVLTGTATSAVGTMQVTLEPLQ